MIIYPSIEDIQKRDYLLSNENYEERLQYFNDNVCSLINHFTENGVFLWKGHGDFSFDVLMGDHVAYAINDHSYKKELCFFTEEHQAVFLRLRQREIERLQAQIKKSKSYKSKLINFIEGRAGIFQLFQMQVVSNDFLIGSRLGKIKNPQNSDFVIDLEPKTSSEFIVYERLYKHYFTLLLNDSEEARGKRLPKYMGLKFQNAKQRFEKQYERAGDQKLTIEVKLAELRKNEMLRNWLLGTSKTMELDSNAAFLKWLEYEETIKFYDWLKALDQDAIDFRIVQKEEIDVLRQVIINPNIEKFLNFENALLLSCYMNTNKEWVAEKQQLIALIECLKEHKYFKEKISGKIIRLSFIRSFFENRYKVQLKEMAKSGKISPFKMIKFKKDFEKMISQL